MHCVENTTYPFPHRSGDQRSKVQLSAAPCFLGRLEGGTCLAASCSWGFLAVPGVPSVACRFITLVPWPSAPWMSSPLLPSRRVCLCVQILLFYSETSPIGLGPTFILTLSPGRPNFQIRSHIGVVGIGTQHIFYCCLFAKSRPTLHNHVDCSTPGSHPSLSLGFAQIHVHLLMGDKVPPRLLNKDSGWEVDAILEGIGVVEAIQPSIAYRTTA